MATHLKIIRRFFFSLFIEALFRVGLKNNLTGQNKAFWSIC